MRNINEFKKLIEKYRSLTLADFENARENVDWCDKENVTPQDALTVLTGFGNCLDCTLCWVRNEAVKKAKFGFVHVSLFGSVHFSFCIDCVWWSEETNKSGHPCTVDVTYKAIEFAKTDAECIETCKARADYMEEWLKQKLENNENEKIC